MATVTVRTSPNTYGVVSSPGKQVFYHHTTFSNSTLHFCKFLQFKNPFRISTSPIKTPILRPGPGPGPVHATRSSESHTFDVVVIGAGIIGLTIARQFLLKSNLSVAVVDAAVPCSGATGAGQGYIWRIHKDPRSDTWDLAMRSHQLWELLADNLRNQGLDPLQTLGWMKTGSLLVGRTVEESALLKKRVEQLSDAGVEAVFLSNEDLLSEEPALTVGIEGAAAFLPDDYQLDARRTAAFIEEGNRQFAVEGRYAEFYHEPVTSLLRSGSSGEVEAVQTSKNIIYSRKAFIVAAGCWSGSLMRDLIRQLDIKLNLPVKPRKGHLLVFENFRCFKLNHGLMEVGYVNHYSAAMGSATPGRAPVYDEENLSVSMTATMDMSGSLVLGSSRQFVGFSTEIDESIINFIWERAAEFFPLLREQSLEDLRKISEVRVGLRPYRAGGRPVIGHVPGLSNIFLAAGHEGQGLSLALGTAELIADIVLGNSAKINPAPFTLQGDSC